MTNASAPAVPATVPPPRGLRSKISPFGGFASAALLYLAIENDSFQHVAWFSLVPLLYSLHLAQDSARQRFFEGLSFLGTLGIAYFRADTAPILLGIQSGIFAVAAGPILQGQRGLVKAIRLGLLWTGLEVFRGPLCPFPEALVPGWLTVGSAVRPGSPESQTANVVGLYGLSFAVSLSSCFFFGVLVEQRLWRQIVCFAAGLAVPLVCHGYGVSAANEAAVPARRADIVLVTAHSSDDGTLAALTRTIPATTGGLIVWPATSSAMTSNATGPAQFENVAREATSMALTIAPVAPGQEHYQAIVADSTGRIRETFAQDGQTPVLVKTPHGLIGVGVEDDFDSPLLARAATTLGAQLLISIALETEAWRDCAVRHRSSLDAYRSIENHRWILRTSRRGCAVMNPLGHPTIDIRGIGWAGEAESAWIDVTTAYTRWGWWVEPMILAGAGWVLVGALIHWVTHRQRV